MRIKTESHISYKEGVEETFQTIKLKECESVRTDLFIADQNIICNDVILNSFLNSIITSIT